MAATVVQLSAQLVCIHVPEMIQNTLVVETTKRKKNCSLSAEWVQDLPVGKLETVLFGAKYSCSADIFFVWSQSPEQF